MSIWKNDKPKPSKPLIDLSFCEEFLDQIEKCKGYKRTDGMSEKDRNAFILDWMLITRQLKASGVDLSKIKFFCKEGEKEVAYEPV